MERDERIRGRAVGRGFALGHAIAKEIFIDATFRAFYEEALENTKAGGCENAAGGNTEEAGI